MKFEANPAAYFRSARDLSVAASHLMNHPSETPLPALFLISRSIELSTKSLLLATGMSTSELARKPFRHDLTNLIKTAIDRQLIGSTLSPAHVSAIELLSREYDSNSLGYIEEGRRYLLPRFDLVDEAAARLL